MVLKERRKLVLMVRETPLHRNHLRTMADLSELGAIIAPPVPAFYTKPASLDDLVDHTESAGPRACSQIETGLFTTLERNLEAAGAAPQSRGPPPSTARPAVQVASRGARHTGNRLMHNTFLPR